MTQQRIKQKMGEKGFLAAAIISLLFVVGGILFINHSKEDATIMQPAEVSNPAVVADKLDVSEPEAKDIVKAIEKERSKAPATSWVVSANDTQEAAKIVEKQIESKTAPPMPPADKTVVTPRETKVDVYRIDMDADWEIGVGYGNHDGKSYIPVEAQRNYAKHKAIAAEIHMDTGLRKVEGYEVKHVWRF